VALTDASANVVNKYAYTPFGKIAGQQESISQPFKFVGKYGVMTEPNGLYYMKARYYDSSIGRFISEDPKSFDGGDVNLMAYTGGNPVMSIDPDGLASFNFNQFANEVEKNRFDLSATLGTLGATLGVGTMPKSAGELRMLGPKENINPITSQLSRWSGRFGERALREFGRTAAGVALSGAATAATVFEGFYDWGVIGRAAISATTFGGSSCGR